MKQAEVIWAVANIGGPATAAEIISIVPEATSADANTVTDMWRYGLLARRKRREPDTSGKRPYEYVITSADMNE